MAEEKKVEYPSTTYLCRIAKALQLEDDLCREMHETGIINVTGGDQGKASEQLVCMCANSTCRLNEKILQNFVYDVIINNKAFA